jgi:hypothetical protein
MAAYNFPNSPSDGDTVTSNGITYTYSSSKTRWDGAAPSGSSTTVYATIDDLPLSGASTGDQAYVSGNNRLYIWNGTGWYNIALINTTPSISGAASSYTLASDGTATTVTITATDPEGIPITYSIASDTSGNVATVTQGTGANTNVFTITPSTNTANAGTFSLTFRASDGVNIATAVSEFTLVFSIENSNYTTALITSVGANNAVNNSFTDSSSNSHTITANGNVTQNTFSPYRHGGYSTYFDGSGDVITVTETNNSFTFGTGDYTFEAWVYPTGSGQQTIFGRTSTGNTAFPYIYLASGTNLLNVYYSSAIAASSGAVSNYVWTHIAICRESGTTKIFINGALDGSASDSTNLVSPSTFVTIGGSGSAAANAFAGYISDARIVKGTAVYTSNFTPPTERLTAITNTSLLACHLPYFADGSTNNHTITVNGNTNIQPFSPYTHDGYSTADNGGSMYFDGTGDYLTIADDASLDMGSSDFTIEGWYYPITTPTHNVGLLSKRANASETGGVLIYFGTGGLAPHLLVHIGTGWAINSVSTKSFKLDSWNHFAIVRSGSSFKLYVNGQAGVSVTNSGSIPDNSRAFTIGAMGDSGAGPITQCNIAEFRVVKGTAVYTADFTPPTAPLTAITNTSLLLSGTDAAIIDKSQSVKTITLNGDVKSSTTETKYLTSSMYFDGAGDYITMTPSSLFAFGTGDFTIEGWVYITATGDKGIFQQGTSNFPVTNSNSVALQITNASPADSEWAIYAANSYHESTVNYSLNQWYHFAVVRASSTTKLYVNGTEALSIADSVNYTGTYMGVGSIYGAANAQCFVGYIEDFRITKGLARYTSNFTPPTAALEG